MDEVLKCTQDLMMWYFVEFVNNILGTDYNYYQMNETEQAKWRKLQANFKWPERDE